MNRNDGGTRRFSWECRWFSFELSVDRLFFHIIAQHRGGIGNCRLFGASTLCLRVEISDVDADHARGMEFWVCHDHALAISGRETELAEN